MARRGSILGQFIPRPSLMLDSPAYRALSLSGHKVLARIECEHSKHGGADNGVLPVTFNNFADYGIDRQSIAPAIRECVALGFLEITEKGRSGNGEFRRANKFRLTYLSRRGGLRPTHEWQNISTFEEAKQIAKMARRSKTRSSTVAHRLPSASTVPPRDIDSSRVLHPEKDARSRVENPTAEGVYGVERPHW